MVEMSDAPGDCYLGIDNGTQGLSVVLTDANLKRLVTGESSYEFVPDTDAGCYEQLTDDWDLALTDAMKSVHCYLSEHKSLQIKAIGISGQMHGEVLVNHEGQPLSSVRLWCDGRNEDEGEELTLAFQFKVPKRATCARFLWTARNRPELASRVAHVTTPAGWMAYRLTGDFVLGIGDASGIFPIDADTLVYDENMLQTFDNLVGNADIPSIRDILPTVRRAGQDSGVLTQQGAALLGFQLPPDYPIAIAAAEGDQVAALAGSLIGRDGIVSCSFGTSVCANVVSKHGAVELPVEPSVDHFCGADGKNIHMVWLRNGTTFFNTMVASYGILSDKNDAFSAVMPQMLNAAPDCGGLLALPFMDDEPGLQVSRGGTALLLGLNGNNATPGNIAKAALLSTMFNLKLGCKILQENGVVMKELVLTGGLSKSPACGQILANVFGLPTQLLEAADEGSCWGAAVLAKYRHLSIGDNGNDWTLFLESIMKEKRIEQTRFEPDFNAVHEYSKVFNRYQVLVKLQTQLANV